MPSIASVGVSKSGILAFEKSGRTSFTALCASHVATTGFLRPRRRCFSTASIVAFAASTDEASAVGQLMTSTTSVFGSCMTASMATE